jgi:hypothetical protein
MKGLRLDAHHKIQMDVAGCEDELITVEVSISEDGRRLMFDPDDAEAWHCTIPIKRIQNLVWLAGVVHGRRSAMADARRQAEDARHAHVRPRPRPSIAAPDDL